MILQMEPAVHVVNTVRDLVLVSDSSQHEGLGVGDDGLADAGHAQRVTAELVRAVVRLIILAVAAGDEEVVRGAVLSSPGSLHHRVLPVLHQVSLVGQGEAARLALLIVFCAAEPILLLYAGGVVQVV